MFPRSELRTADRDRYRLLSVLCCVAAASAGPAAAEVTLDFENPRLAAHLVSHDASVTVSAVEKGVVFAEEGAATYRFSGERLVVRGSAVEEGLEVAVSADGEAWKSAGAFSGHRMVDVDLRPFGEVGFIRLTGERGTVSHPAVPAQNGAFESPVFQLVAQLRKPATVFWGAGATGGSPISGKPDRYATPQSLECEVVSAGSLPGGMYSYVILTTFDEGNEKRYAIQGRASVGSGGLIRLTWPEMIGSVERLAKQAKQGKAELEKTLSLEEEEEAEGEEDGLDEEEDPFPDDEDAEGGAARKGPPEYYFEVYRRGPGEEAARLVHRLPKGELLEWVDDGTAKPGEALDPRLELQSVIRRKLNRPYPLEPELEAHFGALPRGSYAYRVSAILPAGEMPAGPPVVAEAGHATNEVILKWDEVRNATQYKVYRGAASRPEGPTKFLAQLPAPITAFADHGIVEPGDGVRVALDYRASPAEDDLPRATWQPVPNAGLVDLTGKTAVQFRAAANSDPSGYTPAFAGVAICEKGQSPARPERVADLAYRWPGQHPWDTFRPLLGPGAVVPVSGDARTQVVFGEKRRINCFAGAASGSLFCIRDYDVQYFSELTNDWRPLFAVRNNSHLLRLVAFRPVETRAVRVVSFGEQLFGAYQINMRLRGFAVGLVPVCATKMSLNHQKLAQVTAASHYDMYRPVLMLQGRNRLKLELRDLVGVDTTVTVQAVSLPEKGDPILLGKRENIPVPSGGSVATTLDFVVAESVSGWVSFELIEQTTGKKLYTFQYRARMAPPLALSVLKPGYRETIFESQPDKTVEAEVLLGASADRFPGHRIAASILRVGASTPLMSREHHPIASPRWSVEFDGSKLPYGSYTLVAQLLKPGGLVSQRAERPFHRCAPSPYGESWVGRRGLMFLDGKPLIGLKMLGMGVGHFDRRILDQARKTGFNMLDTSGEEARARGAYSTARVPLPQNRAGEGWCQRRFQTMNTSDPGLISRLAGIKIDPSAVAYMYGDEPDVKAEAGKDISALFPGYHMLKKVDPYHPALTLLFDSNGFLGRFGVTCDIYCVEPYLYASYSDTRREAAARMKKIAIWTHAAVLFAQRPLLGCRKAVWAYPMNWDPRVWNGERDSRIPSFRENRCFLYFLLNEGISGFLFYHYCTSYYHAKLNPLFWEGHRAVVQEMDFLMPFLLDEKIADPVAVEPDTASLSLGLFKHGDDYALLASNLDAYPVRTRIHLPASVKADTFSVLSEDRSVMSADGALEDSFDGFGVHVYTTAKEPPSLPMTKILKDGRFLRGPRRDVQPDNLASETRGAKAQASHTIWWFNSALFAIDDDRETCWNTSAWLKSGKMAGDWLEVTFLKPQEISRVVVRSWKPKYFHDFDDTDNLVSDFDLQVWKEDWQTVKEVRDNPSEVAEVKFDAVTTPKIRVVVQKGLCVAEVEAYR